MPRASDYLRSRFPDGDSQALRVVRPRRGRGRAVDGAVVSDDLAEALRYRDQVLKALPVDDEADRMTAALMQRHYGKQGPGRRLVRR